MLAQGQPSAQAAQIPPRQASISNPCAFDAQSLPSVYPCEPQTIIMEEVRLAVGGAEIKAGRGVVSLEPERTFARGLVVETDAVLESGGGATTLRSRSMNVDYVKPGWLAAISEPQGSPMAHCHPWDVEEIRRRTTGGRPADLHAQQDGQIDSDRGFDRSCSPRRCREEPVVVAGGKRPSECAAGGGQSGNARVLPRRGQNHREAHFEQQGMANSSGLCSVHGGRSGRAASPTEPDLPPDVCGRQAAIASAAAAANTAAEAAAAAASVAAGAAASMTSSTHWDGAGDRRHFGV